MTLAQVKLQLSDVQAVAMTIWAEARAESVQGQIAVGCVIRNRLLRPRRFADTFKGVCHQKAQFSCWAPADGEKNYERLVSFCTAALEKTREWPAQQMWIAEGIIDGRCGDNTNRADHYHADYVSPTWAKGQISLVKYGVHIFYQLP